MGSICSGNKKKNYEQTQENRGFQAQPDIISTAPKSGPIKRENSPPLGRSSQPPAASSNQTSQSITKRRPSIDRSSSKPLDEKTVRSDPKKTDSEPAEKKISKALNLQGVSEEGNPNLLNGVKINGSIPHSSLASSSPNDIKSKEPVISFKLLRVPGYASFLQDLFYSPFSESPEAKSYLNTMAVESQTFNSKFINKDENSSMFSHSIREGPGGYSAEKDWVRALQKGVVNFTKYEESVGQMRSEYMELYIFLTKKPPNIKKNSKFLFYKKLIFFSSNFSLYLKFFLFLNHHPFSSKKFFIF